MGGVNHCSLHCRLAKFRGLMYNAEYGHTSCDKVRSAESAVRCYTELH
jgi:hypothetical protein